jgi:hypothetical protein
MLSFAGTQPFVLVSNTHSHAHSHARAMHERTHPGTHARTHPGTHARTHAHTHSRTHTETHAPCTLRARTHNRISWDCRCPANLLSVCGMKDKVAVTTQLVSAPGDVCVALRHLPRSVGPDEPIAAGMAALASAPLRSGQHVGNAFQLVLREVCSSLAELKSTYLCERHFCVGCLSHESNPFTRARVTCSLQAAPCGKPHTHFFTAPKRNAREALDLHCYAAHTHALCLSCHCNFCGDTVSTTARHQCHTMFHNTVLTSTRCAHVMNIPIIAGALVRCCHGNR